MQSQKWRLIAAFVAFGALAAVANAQNSGQKQPAKDTPAKDAPAKPIALDKAPPADTGGFWMFPSPAPTQHWIVTDRPGFSDSAELVERGHLQLEGGYTYTFDRNDGRRISDHRLPEAAFRTGLTDWLEFRMAWTGWSFTDTLGPFKTPAGRHITHEDHDDGGTDMNVGMKFRLARQDGWVPNLAMITTLGLPTGRDSKSANNVVPEIKFPWNYVINHQFTVYGSVLGRVQDGSEGQFYQTGVTLAGAYRVNDNLSLYTEYFGLYRADHHEDCSHILSAGPIIHITENISLDGRVGMGLNDQSPNFQASIGMGIRF